MKDVRRPGGLIVTARKTWSVLRITLASRFAYAGELFIRSIFIVFILFIFTQLWRSTGQVEQTGFTLQQLIWYLAFTEAIMLSTGFGVGEVDREVRSGDIAYRLSRPLAYPLYHFGAALGERLLRFVITLMLGVAVALVVVGPLRVTPLALGLALSTTLAGFIADWIWTMAISLLSFWVEETFGLHLLYRRGLMILGGMLIPIDAYPAWLQDIARAMPFQYLVYAPARLFVRPEIGYWIEVNLALVLFGMAGCLPLLIIYHFGLRRVSAQGG